MSEVSEVSEVSEIVYVDPFPDERITELMARVAELDRESEDNANWSFWDADPGVAWEMEEGESYYASLRAVYESAGWEKCYHNERARLHYNVKLRGMGAWRGTRKVLDAANLDDNARERVEEIVEGEVDNNISLWWEDDIPNLIVWEMELGSRGAFARDLGIYSCGRSGGYLNARQWERYPEAMFKLAQLCARSVEWMTSETFGEDAAEFALQVYREERMRELASPRIERIEA